MAVDRDLLAYLGQFVTGHKRQLFERRLQQRTRHLTVVLEDIYQSHNASACLRSCEAFGVQDVHIIENRYSFRLNPDVELGSAQWLTLQRWQSEEQKGSETATRRCLAALRQRGYVLAATAPHAEGVTLEEYDAIRPTALLFGTELEGLSETALAEADVRLHIPLFGFTESLNISVAVAVCLHYLLSQLRRSPVDWHLSETEKEELQLEWIQQAIDSRRLPIILAEYQRRRAE